MSNKRIRRASNNIQAEFTKQRLTKHTSVDNNVKKSSGSSRRYKALLTCVICNADAHGYNFDAISCESCKAFFRRNALRPLEKLKCRGNGDDPCDVNFNVKKRCKRCRLHKCLTAGMRKEWILSDKEKEEKRAKIDQNRHQRQMQVLQQERRPSMKRDSKTDDDLSLEFLSFLNQKCLADVDWANIQAIQDCYTESVKLNQITGISCYPYVQPIESTVDLFRIPLYISSMRLITFIKQLQEFQRLDNNDQVYLVKLNLLTICFFHSIFIYDPRTNNYHEEDTMDPLFSEKDWMKTLHIKFHLEMKQLRNDLIDIFQMDNIIIKLFFIILVFSQQVSLTHASQCLIPDTNALNISKAQNVFVDLIYRYCLHQYGSSRAPILFMRYMTKIIKLQQLVDEIKYTINDYLDVTELSPLSQSLIM